MISLVGLKAKLLVAAGVLLVFIGFTYKVYDTGYNNAVTRLSAQAIEAKLKHDEEIKALEDQFADMERQYLEDEIKNRKEFERKYNNALESVSGYVEDNGFTECNIGTNGVQRVNDILKGSTTKDK